MNVLISLFNKGILKVFLIVIFILLLSFILFPHNTYSQNLYGFSVDVNIENSNSALYFNTRVNIDSYYVFWFDFSIGYALDNILFLESGFVFNPILSMAISNATLGILPYLGIGLRYFYIYGNNSERKGIKIPVELNWNIFHTNILILAFNTVMRIGDEISWGFSFSFGFRWLLDFDDYY